jgi:hypothetical protein
MQMIEMKMQFVSVLFNRKGTQRVSLRRTKKGYSISNPLRDLEKTFARLRG